MKSSFLEHLQELLRNVTAQNQQEKEYKSRFLQYVSSSFCDKTNTEPGHFTASGFVRSPDSEKVLLIFHPRFQKWIQPGGHLEETDTTILEAASREIFEETGVQDVEWDGTIRLDIHHVPAVGNISKHLHFDVQLGFVAPICSNDGSLQSQWLQYDTIDDAQTDSSVMRFLRGWL